MKIIVRAEKSRLARYRPSVLLTTEMKTFGGCCLARRRNIRKSNNEKHREGSRVVCRLTIGAKREKHSRYALNLLGCRCDGNFL